MGLAFSEWRPASVAKQHIYGFANQRLNFDPGLAWHAFVQGDLVQRTG